LPLSDCRQEHLNFLVVVLEKGSEVSSVTEPEESPELLLELVLNGDDLLIDARLDVFFNREGFVQQEDWQLIRPLHFDLFRAEELDERC